MGNTAIRVQGLGKEYRIGAHRARYRTFRETITEAVASPFRRAGNLLRGQAYGAAELTETIWALQDVSFEVKHGDVVGIIGRNGAGKSTLLKVLSRITEPTTGRAEVYGRVGSLLEVGTGFHQELTGRENIYLNAAILGMKRAEIDRKFDEIVAFAEVERFIDTPVKHYSSGMGLRLGFAVAAHLEPEILVVDEVLAVGDAQFQKKCLNKMQQISRSGRTILFVSHNMAAIRNICQQAIILEAGQVKAQGETNPLVDQYIARSGTLDGDWIPTETEHFHIDDVRIISNDHEVIKTSDQVEIRVRFTPKVAISDPGLYVSFLTSDGLRLAGVDFKDFTTIGALPADIPYEMGFTLNRLSLLPGRYQIELHLKDMLSKTIDIVPRNLTFDVITTPVYQGRQLGRWFGHVALDVEQAFANEVESDGSLYTAHRK